jgi:hypothetical protein
VNAKSTVSDPSPFCVIDVTVTPVFDDVAWAAANADSDWIDPYWALNVLYAR